MTWGPAIRSVGQTSTTLCLVAALAGCNLLVGSEDRDAFPDNCGAETLITARFSFSDDRNGHCYSLVQSDDADNGTDFTTAKDSCTEAGGALACIDDRVELELIGRSVPTVAWLGMNARTSADSSFSCIDGKRFNPDFNAWASEEPMSSNACTVVSSGFVATSGCGNGIANWLCEFAPPGQ